MYCLIGNWTYPTEMFRGWNFCPFSRRIHHFESFAQFDTSLIADAFLMSLVSEHRRKTTLLSTPLLAFTLEEILQRSPTPFLIAKCAECTLRKELGEWAWLINALLSISVYLQLFAQHVKKSFVLNAFISINSLSMRMCNRRGRNVKKHGRGSLEDRVSVDRNGSCH